MHGPLNAKVIHCNCRPNFHQHSAHTRRRNLASNIGGREAKSTMDIRNF